VPTHMNQHVHVAMALAAPVILQQRQQQIVLV
jgi:hypothetical protein